MTKNFNDWRDEARWVKGGCPKCREEILLDSEDEQIAECNCCGHTFTPEKSQLEKTEVEITHQGDIIEMVDYLVPMEELENDI